MKRKPLSAARKREIADAQKAIKALVKQPGFDAHRIANSLTEALFGFGLNPGSFGAQISQTDTMLLQIRGYLISNNRSLLSYAYSELGPIRTAIDIPVDDAIRGGVEFSSKQFSPSQLMDLKTYMDRESILLRSVAQAERWNRLYGGAGIMSIVEEDPSTPFDISSLRRGGRLELRATDMWELYYDKQAVEGYDPAPIPLDDPSMAYYRYYGHNVHKSRVMKLKGLEAPSFLRPRLRGWGMSIVEHMIRSMNQFLKSSNVAFEVLDEFKVDIFQLQGLNETMQNADGAAKVNARVRLTNRSKNYLNAMVLDAQDKYEQKQLTFSGLAEIIKEIRIHLSAELRMPVTKLWGLSAAGFSSGEDDLENYNGMVESEVRAKIRHQIIKSAEICAQHLFGTYPTDLNFEFAPLRVLNSEQQENVREKQFNRLVTMYEKGLITAQEFKQAVNKAKLSPIQINETNDAEIRPGEDDSEATPGEGSAAEDKGEDPINEPIRTGITPAARAREARANNSNDEYEDPPEDIAQNEAGALALMNPGKVDEALWEKAKHASQQGLGKIKWAFVTWWYKKHGGHFG